MTRYIFQGACHSGLGHLDARRRDTAALELPPLSCTCARTSVRVACGGVCSIGRVLVAVGVRLCGCVCPGMLVVVAGRGGMQQSHAAKRDGWAATSSCSSQVYGCA